MGPLIQISAPGQSTAGVGFEDPLAMLALCHRRVEQQCATLRRLVDHLQTHGSDETAREAATGVLRYFSTAAVHHHADEEDDLFPALIESVAGSDAVRLRQLIERLQEDHDALTQRWTALRPALLQVLAGQSLHLDGTLVREFGEKYDQHIAIEEQELLPMARRWLKQQTLQHIGQAMKERRSPPT